MLVLMTHSLIVELLAERPESDLRDLRARYIAQRQRVDVEIEQIDEALTKQAKRRGGKASARQNGSRPVGSTRELILGALREKGRSSPAELRAGFEQEGRSAKSIYNMLRTLTLEGEVVRVADGLYELASDNGSRAGEPSSDATSVGSGGMGGKAPWPQQEGLAVATAPNRSG
jgi:hypothetical protein